MRRNPVEFQLFSLQIVQSLVLEWLNRFTAQSTRATESSWISTVLSPNCRSLVSRCEQESHILSPWCDRSKTCKIKICKTVFLLGVAGRFTALSSIQRHAYAPETRNTDSGRLIQLACKLFIPAIKQDIQSVQRDFLRRLHLSSPWFRQILGVHSDLPSNNLALADS